MKRIRTISVIAIIGLFGSVSSIAQTSKLFGVNRYYGEVGISSFYQKKYREFNNFNEEQKTTNFAGGLQFNSSSYIWTPKFLIIDFDLGYNPISENNLYTITPDRNEIKTLKKLNLKTILLADKSITTTAFLSLNDNFVKRDLLTDVRYKSMVKGVLLKYNNKVLPFEVEINDSKWAQREIEFNRKSQNEKLLIGTRMEKSFSKRDNSDLHFYHNENKYSGFESYQTFNTNNILDFSNKIYFDTLHRQSLRSKFMLTDQKGTQTFKRIQLIEGFNIDLPIDFKFYGDYQYLSQTQPTSSSKMHTANAKIKHQLYSSLGTSVYYQYSNLTQTAFDEVNNRYGATLIYQKKIPTGTLKLNYSLYRMHQNLSQKESVVEIFDEEHVIADDQITFLKNPFVRLNTVFITDVSGTIIYQQNMDYILIERNDFVEIQRVSGGQIVNGQLILIQYVYTLNNDHSFVLTNQSAGISTFLFNGKLELYAKIGKQRYTNVDTTGITILKPFNSSAYGISFNYKIAKSGIDFENFESNINPYRMWRYYVDVSGSIGSKLRYKLSASRKHFERLDIARTEEYFDLLGGINYAISSKSRVNLVVSYRKQDGREIDLDLLNARIQYSTVVRLLHINIGGNLFRRDYLNEKIDYNNLYVQLIRNF